MGVKEEGRKTFWSKDTEHDESKIMRRHEAEEQTRSPLLEKEGVGGGKPGEVR